MKWYAYQFCRPDGTPFYVGSGGIRRTHCMSRNNSFVIDILAEIKLSGLKATKILEEFDDEKSARDRELELIKKYGRIIDGGILANLRIGDRGGVQGRKLSDEQRQLMSESRKGRKHTEEWKRKQSERQQSRVWSDEERAAHGRRSRESKIMKNCRKSADG